MTTMTFDYVFKGSRRMEPVVIAIAQQSRDVRSKLLLLKKIFTFERLLLISYQPQ